MRANVLNQLLLLIICLVNNLACSYRFSHLQELKYPFRTVAIEGVYDTSGEILPHDILWTEMQRAFIRDGRLTLTEPSQADALVTLHITEAALKAAGTVVDQDRNADGKSTRRDPEIYKGHNPPNYEGLKTLTRGGEIADKQSLTAAVNVKIWDISKQEVVLNRDYNLSEIFMSADNVGDPMNEFLNHEEKLASDFRRMSQNLAHRVLQDFFITN